MRRRTLLIGANYGRTYAAPIAMQPGLELVALASRGSATSKRFARRYALPLISSDDELFATPFEVAVVAVADPEALVYKLLAKGIHVLCEHPVSPGFLRKASALARRRRVVFHVNTHFSDLAAGQSFIEECRRRRRPRFCSITAHPRTFFSALDLLATAIPVSPLRDVHVAGFGGNQLGTVAARMGGVDFACTCTAYLSPVDNWSDVFIGHRVSVAFAGGSVVTLGDTYGPVVLSSYGHPRSQERWRLAKARDRQSLLRQRHIANVRALERFVAAIRRRTPAKDRARRARQLEWVADTWHSLKLALMDAGRADQRSSRQRMR